MLLLTDLLELIGMLLLVAAVATLAWTILGAPAGLAAAGAGCLGTSAALVLLGRRQ